MPTMKRRLVVAVAGLGVAGLTVTLSGSPADASHELTRLTSVPAVVDARGGTAPHVLSPGPTEHPGAQGALKPENPTRPGPHSGDAGAPPPRAPDPAGTPGPPPNRE